MKPFSLALITALIWGIVPIIEKLGLAKVPPMIGLYARSVGVMAGLFFYSFLITPARVMRECDLKSFVLLAISGFMASMLGQFVFYHSLKDGVASKMTTVAGTYPLITFVLALFILGEQLTAAKLAGIVLVVSGVMLLR